MKRTPRYVRLMSLGLSVSAWQLALNFERTLFDDWLNGADTLPMFDLVSRITTATLILTLANVVWLLIPQRKN